MKTQVDNSLGNSPPVCAVPSLAGTLSEQRVWADFMEAFIRSSGLPLELSRKDGNGSGSCYGMRMPGFCQLIHERNSPFLRKICVLFNRQLEEMAVDHPHDARCFAGIQLTAVPIHDNAENVKYFKTGHVMPEPPAAGDFPKVMHQLSHAGLEALTQEAKEAWLAIPVMEAERYQAFVDLLDAFARQISGETAEHDNSPHDADSLMMCEAQRYIENNSAKHVKLSEVAQAVGLSPNYFCSKFHELTGLSFTDYLAGIRIARAAHLLCEPGMRIKEIAYDTGFTSISQFNRVFHKMMGVSPSEYRQHGGHEAELKNAPGKSFVISKNPVAAPSKEV